MNRSLKLIGGACALAVLLVAWRVGYRAFVQSQGRTPEGYLLLTAIPDASGFEPKDLPSGPILSNQSASDVAVNFGYKVGGIPYSYSLSLAFPPKAEAGNATLTARHGGRDASVDTPAIRRWDAPRKAFSTALEARVDPRPAVPALCIKTVLGPSDTSFELEGASICIAQRDATGACHPETLACGLIRQ